MHTRKSVVLGLFLFLIISCEKSTTSNTDTSSTGTGGSLARFAIVGNYLYLMDYAILQVYDISTSRAVKKNSVLIGLSIETIFPYKDKLFIGSTQGMYIYSIADPANPKRLGTAKHVRSCDPVVANDSISYVTLQGDGMCGAAQDALYIYSVKDVMNPVQLSMTPISKPRGIGLRDSVLFICRGTTGLTAMSVKDPFKPKELYTLQDANYVDVIPYEQLLICYVSNGLLLYDISNLEKLSKLQFLNND